MHYVFMDLEMNAIAGVYKEERQICRSEVIQIGAVMLDDSLKEISSFNTLVKPAYNTRIYERYEKLTGITTEMVADAPIFEIGLKQFVEWVETIAGKEYSIYAWSDSDLKQVKSEIMLKKIAVDESIQHMFEQWNDFQQTYDRLFGVSNAISLADAIKSAGLSFEGRQHDALWDARNTAALFMLIKDDEQYKKKVKPLVDLFQPTENFGTKLGDLFHFEELPME